jgi:hypothetical protein
MTLIPVLSRSFKSNNQDPTPDDRFPRAGKLSSADHSCMSMSRIFDRVSNTALHGSESEENELIETIERLLNYPSKLDSWFLRGGCIEVRLCFSLRSL